MAISLSPLEQDLTCPVCLEIFTDPVILPCSHSFCRKCLERSWQEKLENNCPVCRCRPSDHFSPNLALRNTCESYLQQKRVRDSDPQRCSLHSEKLILFCVHDEKLVCTQCVSQDHQNHSFCSISKAASPRKEKLKTHLTSLEAKLEIFEKFKDISDQEAAHIKSQAQNIETQIREEFEKLHQFLMEEEEATIAALKEEEEKKSQRMKKKIEQLDEQIMEISSRVTELNIILKNDALIVQDFKKASQRAQYTVPDPELESGALIDVAKHLGNLSCKVWKKMKNLCPYFPVVLDPNTANPSLSISADLSSFSPSAKNLSLPDNPERINAYSGILGSEGFSSGTHRWEVVVGDSEDWIVGVAAESVSRKEACLSLPEHGFCCIWRDADEISAGISMNSSKTLMTKPTIQRIRVTLNWEKGLVTFTDPHSNKDLYSFDLTFTKKMYPYFNNDGKNSLKVLPAYIKF
ncbi:nuclear factor 7, brain-like [Colossoma macropomum]|uniref:nuclear factor 7, brain-like n=1 Tax=Colossoma macropomum TaxID=42526 RepID=UPI001864728E|nr:nuclear factor 7, brain-like [Colossoma macropomum]